jgi:hypothetical protein
MHFEVAWHEEFMKRYGKEWEAKAEEIRCVRLVEESEMDVAPDQEMILLDDARNAMILVEEADIEMSFAPGESGHDAFVEGQEGLQCALHAARNVTKGVRDEALTLSNFETIHETCHHSDEEFQGFNCTVLVKAFEMSKRHNCFEFARSATKSGMRGLCVSLGNHLCGVVLHKPGHWYSLRKAEHGFDKVDSIGNDGAGSIEALSFDTGMTQCWRSTNDGHRALIIYTNIGMNEWHKCIEALREPATYVELHENLWNEQKCIRPNRDPCECTVACVVGECLSSCGLVECQPSCRWGDECGNQRVHKRDFPETHVENVGLKGFGLFASARVSANVVVGVYSGEVCQRRDARKRAKDSRGEYLVEMKVGPDTYYVDAEALGTKMRYVNHSCNPNTQWRVWEVGNEPVLVLESLCCIEKNTEVNVSYGRNYWIQPGLPKDGGFHCLCGCEAKPSAIELSSDEEVRVLMIRTCDDV